MSKPRNTSPPGLVIEGDRLRGDNGGWLVESGTVTKYLFRFVCNGRMVKGPDMFPATSKPDSPLPGQYPEDPDANILPSAGLAGQSCYVDVSGGTVSDYPTGKVIEWGDPKRSNLVIVPAQSTPPAAPNGPAALALIENVAIPELVGSYGYRLTKSMNPSPAAFARTAISKSEAAMRSAVAYLKGQ